MTKTLRSALYSLVLAPLLVASCGGVGASDNDGENAADSADSASVTASLSSLTTDGVDMTATTSAAAATSAQVKAMTLLQPTACATAQVVGSVVTYTFNGCTGPYGLVSLTGSLTATYSMVTSGSVT